MSTKVLHLSYLSKGLRSLNPVPYHAAHISHEMHIDQNENTVVFGVTDCYSGKLVSHSIMPIKNNPIIY